MLHLSLFAYMDSASVRLTAGVMPLRGTGGFDLAQPDGVGRDNATLTEPTSSHANCLKTRTLRSSSPTRRVHAVLGGISGAT